MDANQQEARISLAIQAYKQGQFKIPTAAAKAFDVSKNTVLRRLRGTRHSKVLLLRPVYLHQMRRMLL
jgi:transposase